MQKKQGISLIVLSITILVMAILAVTAIIALEDTGIIGHSKTTTAKHNYAEEYTRLQVIKNGILTDNLGTITVDSYITELSNKGLIESQITNADGSKTVTTKAGFTVNVSQNGTSDLSIVIDGYTQQNSNTGNTDTTVIPTISLDKTTISKTIDSGTTATATISATTANTTGAITWTSSDTSVATVSGNGNSAVVTMKAGGNAIITASCDGVSATCSVVVTENVVDLITFTFHGTEYKAKVGMTWADWVGSAYDTTEKSWTLDEYIAETGHSPGGVYTEEELREQGIVSLTYGRAWIASDGRVSMTGYLYYDENGELVMFEQYTNGTYAGDWYLVISGQGSSTIQYQDDAIVSGTEYSMYYD